MKPNLPAIIIFFFFLSFSIRAQSPLVKQWDFSYGGYDSDFLGQVLPCADGGFFAAGNSLSDSLYEKSANNYDSTRTTYDWWVIKCDANGTELWDITLGGSSMEFYYNAISTSDSGLLVVGSTKSPVSGNVSSPTKGLTDMWVVKLTSGGTIQWEKRLGGDSTDAASTALEVPGGYMIGGYTNSTVSGDVSQPSFGTFDYWILRLDANGNVLWDKRYGGPDSESLNSILSTPEHGFLLAGASISDAGGTKSQNNYVQGQADIWFVMTDSSGGVITDKTIGSLDNDYAIRAISTNDSCYLVMALNFANAGADKTENTYGVDDFWLMKLDTALQFQWQHSVGGNSNEDDVGSLFEMQDGTYLVSGTSYSVPGFWKSETNIGPEATWVLKIDQQGNKVWDKTIMTPFSHDEFGTAIQLQDGCILIANDGQGMTGLEKTDTSWSFDYWCIKFCDTTSITSQVPQVGFYSSDTVWCDKKAIDYFDISTNNPTSWQWYFQGAVPDTSTEQNPDSIYYPAYGSFDVDLVVCNAAGCDSLHMTAFINELQLPPAPVITVSNDTLYITQLPSYTYQWYNQNGIIAGETGSYYVASQPGSYYVTVEDSIGCISASGTFVFTAMPVVQNTGTGAWLAETFTGSYKLIVILDKNEQAEIILSDISGRIIKDIFYRNMNAGKNVVDLNTTGLTPGVYTCSIKTPTLKSVVRLVFR